MEMTAAIEALSYFSESSSIKLTTDSNYLRWNREMGLGWKKNGWKTSSKKPVKNRELWIKVDQLNQYHDITWCWVKGTVDIEKTRLPICWLTKVLMSFKC